MTQVRRGSYTLVPLADTADVADRFAGFEPYVASINDAGVVAFQATLTGGGSGVFSAAADGSLSTVIDPAGGPFGEIVSHPDINRDGSTCFYASPRSGGRVVALVRDGGVFRLHEAAGPLGPTINEAGAVAFRVEPEAGHGGILTGYHGAVRSVADTRDGRFSAFHGLPVINGAGSVAFRADLRAGGEGIYLDDRGSLTTMTETGELFAGLGAFPVIDDAGSVAFCATTPDGRSGVFTVTDGRVATVIDSRGPFESFRGVLLANAGRVVFYATPRGGQLGVFSGPDPTADRLIGLGATLFGSTVVDFALNPVSINHAGQLAIRIKLADERQLVVRADP